MKKEEFVKLLENSKGKDIIIEVAGEIVQKVTMKQYTYNIIEDKIYIRNSSNLHFAVINLNLIRHIEKNDLNITIYIDNSKDTKIKISVI